MNDLPKIILDLARWGFEVRFSGQEVGMLDIELLHVSQRYTLKRKVPTTQINYAIIDLIAQHLHEMYRVFDDDEAERLHRP